MHLETVEIYSERSNMAVIRYQERRFPGVLVQGDTLHALCSQAELALGDGPGAKDELSDLLDRLHEMLDHYKAVLLEYGQMLRYVKQAT